MFTKLRLYILNIIGLDLYDAYKVDLLNIRPILNSEINAAKVIKKNPQFKEAELIEDFNNGWVRVLR